MPIIFKQQGPLSCRRRRRRRRRLVHCHYKERDEKQADPHESQGTWRDQVPCLQQPAFLSIVYDVAECV